MLHRVLTLAWIAGLGACAQAAEPELSCLHAISVGPARVPVTACGPADPLGIGNDPKVLRAMQLMGIPRDAVQFRGCAGSHFLASEDPSAGSGGRFIVRYPTDADANVLAPIIHELAHVLQMSMAGGLRGLRNSYSSIKIELSADFMVGYAFGVLLDKTDRDQFQHNLSLVGAYVERFEAAHGTPAQRTEAFRLGAVRRYPYSQFDIRKAYEYFLQNDIARYAANAVR